jgi:hypothetical protein
VSALGPHAGSVEWDDSLAGTTPDGEEIILLEAFIDVGGAHTRKFTAALQHTTISSRPVVCAAKTASAIQQEPPPAGPTPKPKPWPSAAKSG